MGVPSFYRWLVKRYPKIVTDAIVDHETELSLPNPNNGLLEFDNFYLDMNGIIHPCFHPDDHIESPKTYEDVFRNIYEYIDSLFSIVRPRKLLYMAIDGVAPRAKMNQQRARRFRTSKDNQMAEEMEEKLRRQFEKEGKAVLPKEESQVSDSNVITPGTEFMFILSQKLQSYIKLRMSENPAWTNIKIILSDGNVPGEGEHKIMSFIRAQRSSPGYDPNTRHCLYGLDADLIMLALATHEIHFSILREEVLSPRSQIGYASHASNSSSKPETSVSCEKGVFNVTRMQAYQFLNVWVLREYLAFDLDISSEKFEYNLERVIDDFIFVCFFSGNDFLPHMPTLEIHEGCIDLLMHVYKKEFASLGGYLVDIQKVEDKKGGYVKLKRVEKFILAVGQYEDQIFTKRAQLKEKALKRFLHEYNDTKDYDNERDLDEGRSSDIVAISSVSTVDQVLDNTKELKQKLKDYIRHQSDLFKNGFIGTDKVKFGRAGWRERFYTEKFSAQSPGEIEAIRKSVIKKYGEGLQWVLLYYFFGVPSWTWFYPYNYCLPASELKGLSQTSVKFQTGAPFKPFDQLMGVLPPRSSHALPAAFRGLMIGDDSNIIDFYPADFETDIDGKRFTWQGVSKLPFIEEERLLTETKKLESKLKDTEKNRNLQTLDRLFVRFSSEMNLKSVDTEKIKGGKKMDSTIEGLKGTLHLMPEDLIEAPEDDTECTTNDLCFFYEINRVAQLRPHLLEGVIIPEKTVDKEDIVETGLWHEYHGNRTFTMQNPRPKKPDHASQLSSQDWVPGIIFKEPGVGFLGRGQSSPTSQLRGPTTYNKHVVNYTPRNEYNERSKAGSSRSEDFRGIGCPPRLLDSRPCPSPRATSNYVPRPAGSTSWKSQNATHQDWRYNTQYTSSSGPCWRRDYGESSGRRRQPDESFSDKTGWGRGRGRGAPGN